MGSICAVLLLVLYGNLVLIDKSSTYLECNSYCNFWEFAKEISITQKIYEVPNSSIALYQKMEYNDTLNYSYFKHDRENWVTSFSNTEGLKINNYYLEAYYAYINGRGGIVFNNSFYTMKWHDDNRNAERLRYKYGTVIGHCHELIVLVYDGMSCFAHVVMDLFGPLLMLPEDVLMNASILCCGLKGLINDYLDLLEIPQWKRITMGSEEYLAVDKIYTITDPQIYLDFFGISVMRVRKFLEKKYNLTNVEAKDYCLSNRNYRKARYIINMDELFEAVKNHYSDIQWRFLNDTLCPNLSTSAKAYSSVKFMYAPLGSNTMKSIFMKENTVFIMGYTVTDTALSRYFAASHIFMLEYKAMNSSHWEGPGGIVEIPLALKIIGIGLDVFKNKKWPDIIPTSKLF